MVNYYFRFETLQDTAVSIVVVILDGRRLVRTIFFYKLLHSRWRQITSLTVNPKHVFEYFNVVLFVLHR